MEEILIATYVVIDTETYDQRWPGEEKTPDEVEVQGWNGQTIEAVHHYEDGSFRPKYWSPGAFSDMIHQEIVRPKTMDDL